MTWGYAAARPGTGKYCSCVCIDRLFTDRDLFAMHHRAIFRQPLAWERTVTNETNEAVSTEPDVDQTDDAAALETVMIDLDDEVIQALQDRFGDNWKLEAARLLKEAVL
jgi:hypothetical protein